MQTFVAPYKEHTKFYRRGNGADGKIEFHGGVYATDNPEEIDVLLADPEITTTKAVKDKRKKELQAQLDALEEDVALEDKRQAKITKDAKIKVEKTTEVPFE